MLYREARLGKFPHGRQALTAKRAGCCYHRGMGAIRQQFELQDNLAWLKREHLGCRKTHLASETKLKTMQL